MSFFKTITILDSELRMRKNESVHYQDVFFPVCLQSIHDFDLKVSQSSNGGIVFGRKYNLFGALRR